MNTYRLSWKKLKSTGAFTHAIRQRRVHRHVDLGPIAADLKHPRPGLERTNVLQNRYRTGGLTTIRLRHLQPSLS